MVMQKLLYLVRQGRGVRQVHHPDRTAPHLVFISRTNTPLGGADLRALVGRLADHIELSMNGQNKNRVFCNLQILRCHHHPLLAKLRDFRHQGPGINHHPIAQHGHFAPANNAGRQQRKLIGHPINDERMTRIVASLKAHHHIRAL